jgi:hypothetical protein
VAPSIARAMERGTDESDAAWGRLVDVSIVIAIVVMDLVVKEVPVEKGDDRRGYKLPPKRNFNAAAKS